VAELERRDVGFRSLQEKIDTTTPVGKLIFHIFGALAEFERDIIRQRTLAGFAAARARGRTSNRPRSMTPTKLALARQMYDSRQHSLTKIARDSRRESGFDLSAPWTTSRPDGRRHDSPWRLIKRCTLRAAAALAEVPDGVHGLDSNASSPATDARTGSSRCSRYTCSRSAWSTSTP
jgi:Resolvase, N terminal domain